MGQAMERRGLELKIPPLALVPLFGILMGVLAWLTPKLGLPAPWRWWNAGILTLAGFLIALAGVIDFRRARTTVNPLQPDSSSALVNTGIYRFSRNPMYVGFLCWILAWALFLDSPAALLLGLDFIPYMNRFQILPEEQALNQLFGEHYRDYCKQVRRWL